MEQHNHPSFIQFLTEFDRSDLQLRWDHQAEQQKKKSLQDNRFQDQMDKSREGEPSKGDVLQSPSGKQFVILARSDKGFRVRELGGNGKEGNLPHGRKYTAMGKTPLNKAIYKLS